MMHISYGGKGLTPNQAFLAVQEQCLGWETVTPSGVDCGLFHYVDILRAHKWQLKCLPHDCYQVFKIIFTLNFR